VGAGISPGETLFNAHSGYIDLLLQYGFLGTSLVIFHIITFLIRLVVLLTATASIESFWMLQTLLAMVFVNFTERFGFLDYGTLWTIYVSMALSAALELKRMSKKRELSTEP
jgi:O-antigen ligase